MKAPGKHYKFINSKTGYVIYHFTLKNDLNETDAKAQLEKVKADVATKNRIFLDTIYWEEERDN
ncbi:hypothetical protein [Mucilaginibacter sp. UYCu711]|uniref:hypothetical protein n=1 Tax=Mucilaginibacter sp. UYCu711 TaxID=3156339 RepID=UPI003D1DE8BC